MLKHSFSHLTGIGAKTEARLWARGITTWDDLLCHDKGSTLSNPGLIKEIKGSKLHLDKRDPLYFETLLPPDHHWRLYPEFRATTAFVDIETNGIMGRGGYITAISLYDGKKEHYYVRDKNLGNFPRDLRAYDLIVTYNGKTFDIPFIEREFKMTVKKAHLDLRFILHGLGYRGGLKGCERAIGIDRGGCDGLDGYSAVLLWKDYMLTGSEGALETLLAYNMQDSVNLEALLLHVCHRKLKKTPFFSEYDLKASPPPVPRFVPNAAAVKKVLRRGRRKTSRRQGRRLK